MFVKNSCSRTVFLVGAGPGDPELLTLKAFKLLQRADVVLFDALVSAEVLALVQPQAELVAVGKRCGQHSMSQQDINQLLVAKAGQHGCVVRLKGGDPMVFGRASEEIAALHAAGFEVEVVSGITTALAAAASLKVSLTQRQVASSIQLGTLSQAAASADASLSTQVAYMGRAHLRSWACQLLQRYPGHTPVAILSYVSLPNQHCAHSTLLDLAEGRLPQLPADAPTLTIVGEVLRRR